MTPSLQHPASSAQPAAPTPSPPPSNPALRTCGAAQHIALTMYQGCCLTRCLQPWPPARAGQVGHPGRAEALHATWSNAKWTVDRLVMWASSAMTCGGRCCSNADALPTEARSPQTMPVRSQWILPGPPLKQRAVRGPASSRWRSSRPQCSRPPSGVRVMCFSRCPGSAAGAGQHCKRHWEPIGGTRSSAQTLAVSVRVQGVCRAGTHDRRGRVSTPLSVTKSLDFCVLCPAEQGSCIRVRGWGWLFHARCRGLGMWLLTSLHLSLFIPSLSVLQQTHDVT